MSLIKRYLNWVTFFVFFFMVAEFSYSQQENGTALKSGIKSAGISIGWFNPSLDYWKNESEFKNADFNGAISIDAFFGFKLAKNINAKIGVGYWQESVKDSLQGFGTTTLLLTGIPLNVDFTYQISPLKFSIITPYLGLGAEYSFVQHKIKFDLNDDPSPETGSTILGHLIAGFEAKLSEQFAADLNFEYKFGNYKQDFKIETIDPEHPEIPPTTSIVTETISLNGPKISIALKYFF